MQRSYSIKISVNAPGTKAFNIQHEDKTVLCYRRESGSHDTERCMCGVAVRECSEEVFCLGWRRDNERTWLLPNYTGIWLPCVFLSSLSVCLSVSGQTRPLASWHMPESACHRLIISETKAAWPACLDGGAVKERCLNMVLCYIHSLYEGQAFVFCRRSADADQECQDSTLLDGWRVGGHVQILGPVTSHTTTISWWYIHAVLCWGGRGAPTAPPAPSQHNHWKAHCKK